MDTFDLLVVFKDGSGMVIGKVSDYLINPDKNILEVEKNGHFQFFNWDEVKYCGRLFDLRQQEN